MNEQDMMTAILKRRLGELELEIVQLQIAIAQRDEDLQRRLSDIEELKKLLNDGAVAPTQVQKNSFPTQD